MSGAQNLWKNGKIICSGFDTGVDKYCIITNRQSAVGKWIFKKAKGGIYEGKWWTLKSNQ